MKNKNFEKNSLQKYTIANYQDPEIEGFIEDMISKT
jgi:hypothetical protein